METSDSAVLGNPLSTFYLAALDLLEAHRASVSRWRDVRLRALHRDRSRDEGSRHLRASGRRPTNTVGIRGRRVPNRNFAFRIGWPKSGRASMSSMSSTVPATVSRAWTMSGSLMRPRVRCSVGGCGCARSRNSSGRRRSCRNASGSTGRTCCTSFATPDAISTGRGWSPALATTGRCSSAISCRSTSSTPTTVTRVPSGLISEMAHRLAAQPKEPYNRICFGTLLSREQYLHDVQQLGYIDARLPPHGTMTPEEIAIWTEAIGKKD